jgi:hypothetical protein
MEACWVNPSMIGGFSRQVHHIRLSRSFPRLIYGKMPQVNANGKAMPWPRYAWPSRSVSLVIYLNIEERVWEDPPQSTHFSSIFLLPQI